MKKLDAVALALAIVGALNWGFVAIGEFDLVAKIFGMEFGETERPDPSGLRPGRRLRRLVGVPVRGPDGPRPAGRDRCLRNPRAIDARTQEFHMFPSTTPLRAVASVNARPSRTYESGRFCSEPGCSTRLSIYNRAARCGVHEEPRPYYVRGKRRSRAATTHRRDHG